MVEYTKLNDKEVIAHDVPTSIIPGTKIWAIAKRLRISLKLAQEHGYVEKKIGDK